MIEVVSAVYENGVLRPLTPLNLQDHQRVRIQILADETKAEIEEINEIEEISHLFVKAGLMRPSEKRPPLPDPISEAERRRLADILGQAPGKSLSEIIIEERGEW